jgi:hypothetical protein
VGHSMKFEDIIHENLSHGGWCERVLKGTKMSIFGKESTTTMMIDLFLDLGNLALKSIEISVHIAGGIKRGWSVLVILIVSPLLH